MVQWAIGSILHGGSPEIFLVPNQCSTTGVTKAVVCVILFVGSFTYDPLLLFEKSGPCSGLCYTSCRTLVGMRNSSMGDRFDYPQNPALCTELLCC